MKYHVLSVRSSFIDGPIRAIHAAFFHGNASRGGEFPSATNARLAHDIDLPLRLHKNAYNIADVIAPALELVVSGRVAERLSSIPDLTLAETEFAVLYSYRFTVGDLSCGFEHYDAQMQFIDTRTDDASLHETVQRYFHIAAPPVYEIRRMHPSEPNVSILIDDDIEDIPLSTSILRSNPIYSLGGSKIVSDELYQILSPFVDFTYYAHESGEISDAE
ncbi:hypothetical protein Poly51_63380 [Rubripirellula tenax]|uniref:Uncharacterized protein n=1 Tax=Rubripirellula tenax TaxID=2528015 RepID=A0A5C6E415_9BACT|nr:hypothetical protein [Rubripirellula tenax]TWU43560.1 hypothetical protein Poly51_63380 [Rubripirellula tenax]